MTLGGFKHPLGKGLPASGGCGTQKCAVLGVSFLEAWGGDTLGSKMEPNPPTPAQGYPDGQGWSQWIRWALCCVDGMFSEF